MEKFVKERLEVCLSTEDIFEIEDKIGGGMQLEQLIEKVPFCHTYLLTDRWMPSSSSFPSSWSISRGKRTINGIAPS